MNLAQTPAPDGIGRRLLLFLLGPMALLLVAGVISDYHLAADTANAAFDHSLGDNVAALAAQVRPNGQRLGVDLPREAVNVLRTDLDDEVFFLVRGPDAEALAGDADLPLPPGGGNGPGYFDADYRLREVRVAFVRMPTTLGAVTVEVAETTAKRDRMARRILLAMIWPNLLLVAATLVLVWIGVRIGLAPLLRLREEIEARSPRDLAPLPESLAPAEARPLVAAINRLLGMLRGASDAQQKFLANAAHQMRTPLAGLQTQLEVAAEELPPEHRERMVQLSQATRRLGHLANQLLALARSAPEAAISHERHPLDLASLVEDAASDFIDAAIARDIDLGFEAEPAPVLGSKWLLRELLANLIDNAIAYTPREGRVTVRSGRDGATSFIEVEDNGPGIPPAERERVFERFYRAPGVGGEGCGLGLAIVREIADAHGAAIDIGVPADGRGTRLRVTFPFS